VCQDKSYDKMHPWCKKEEHFFAKQRADLRKKKSGFIDIILNVSWSLVSKS